MALPGSGTISMDMIRIELGVPTQTPFGLGEAREGQYGAINPCSTYKPPSSGTGSLSDWWGYDHTQACPPAYDIYIMFEYGCLDGDCVDNELEAYGAFTSGFNPNLTRYYRPTSGTGFAYKIGSIFPTGLPVIYMNSTPYVSCPTAAQCDEQV